MNMKTGLTGLGLFVVAGVLTISCGGTSDTGDSPTAGKGSGGSSAGSTAGGSPASGGKTGSSGGSSAGGTQPGPQGGGDPGPGNGGDGPGPGPGSGGDGPIGNNGGAGNNPACPATQPTDGELCDVMTGFQGCDYDTMNCRCQRMGGGQQAMRAWNCNEVGGGFGGAPFGQGGNGSIGDVECPAARPQTDDVCTGTGFCPYQGGGCVCNDGMFTCFGGN